MDSSVIFLFAMIIGSANCILTGDFTRTINIYPTDPYDGVTRFTIANRGQIALNDVWEDMLHKRSDLAQEFFNQGFLQRLLNNAIAEDQHLVWTNQAIGSNVVRPTANVRLPLQAAGQPVELEMQMTLRDFLTLSGLSRAHARFFFSEFGDSPLTNADFNRQVRFHVHYHATLGNGISHHTLVFSFNIV